MTIRHLKIFVAVYDNMSITRASQSLHMTQPGVTRSIQEMENYYGVRLFERTNHKLYVTMEGRRLYTHAKRVLDAFRVLEEDIGGNETFTVNIGSTFALGSVMMPEVIRRFRERYPKAEIRGYIYNASNLEQMLLRNEIDFAMYEDEVIGPALTSEYFFEDTIVLLLPNGHRMAQKEKIVMADLADEPILAREKGSNGRRKLEEMFFCHDMQLNPVLESCSTTAMIQNVRNGIGAALLPWNLVREHVEAGNVVAKTISDVTTKRGNCLIWVKERRLPSYVLHTMKLCHEVAADMLRTENE